MTGKEAPKSSMILQIEWSEHGSGNTQEDTESLLATEGSDHFVLTKACSTSKWPGGTSSVPKKQSWRIRVADLIGFVMANGQSEPQN